MTGAFDAMDLTQQRKTLMAQEEADRKLKNEKETAEFAQEQKNWTKADEQEHGVEHLNMLQSAIIKQKEAESKGQPFNIDDLSEEQQNAILYGQEHHLGNVSGNDLGNVIKLMRQAGPQVQGKKAQIPIDEGSSKTITNALQIPEANITTDDYGNKFKNAKITGVAVDGTSPDMPMGFKVTREITPGAYKHIGEKTPTFVAPDSKPQNMVEKGNIDLNARPVVKNQDGSISTVKSLSVEQDGKEVLIPSISPDGKALSTKDAIAEWEKTKTKDKPYGDHLGVFSNVADADAYAQQLHSSSIWKKDMDYYTKPTQEDLLKHGGGGDPNAPYVIHPAEFYHSKFNLQKGLADMADQMEAKWGGDKYRERKEAALQRAEQSKGVSAAVTAWQEDQKKNPGQTVSEQRLSLIQKLPDSMSDKDKSAYAKDIIPEKQEKNPTPASLAMDEAQGDPTAKKARELMRQDKINEVAAAADAKEKAKKKYHTDKSSEEKPAEKNKQIARVDDIASDDVVKDAAKDEVRKGKDADKAVEITNARIDKVISGSGGSGKKAAEDLAKELNIPFDKAKKYIKKRIEKQKKSKAE
jgi:hypothetical protein